MDCLRVGCRYFLGSLPDCKFQCGGLYFFGSDRLCLGYLFGRFESESDIFDGAQRFLALFLPETQQSILVVQKHVRLLLERLLQLKKQTTNFGAT